MKERETQSSDFGDPVDKQSIRGHSSEASGEAHFGSDRRHGEDRPSFAPSVAYSIQLGRSGSDPLPFFVESAREVAACSLFLGP